MENPFPPNPIDNVARVRAKMATLLHLNLRIGHILVGPDYYHKMVQEVAGYATAFTPEQMMDSLFSAPVVIVRNVVDFEVGVL